MLPLLENCYKTKEISSQRIEISKKIPSKPIKSLSASPVRASIYHTSSSSSNNNNNSSSSSSSSSHNNNSNNNSNNCLRVKSAEIDSNYNSRKKEITNQQQQQDQNNSNNNNNNNNNPQSIAVLRVMKSIRKQRLIQQRTDEEINRERKDKAEKMLLKNLQRHRYRAEVYAINAYLKSQEQQRFEEMMRCKFGTLNPTLQPRNENNNDTDSSQSHDSDDDSDNHPQKSNQLKKQQSQGNNRVSSPNSKQQQKSNNRSYGV